jgi:arylsulfatase A-like enzyme
VDLAPTLLELVGALPPAGIDGQSLLRLMQGKSKSVRDTTLVEGGVRFVGEGVARGAVISPPWALIRQDRGCGGTSMHLDPNSPPICLYNIEEDPGQEKNVAGFNREVVAELVGRWDKFREARAKEGAALKLSPEAVEALQRTGYNFQPGN